MKRLVVVLLAVAAALCIRDDVGHAVSFTVDLTADEVATATWKWNRIDPSHSAFATVQLFGQTHVKGLIAGWEAQRQQMILSSTAKCILWNAANQATKDLACVAAGDSNGCNLGC